MKRIRYLGSQEYHVFGNDNVEFITLHKLS